MLIPIKRAYVHEGIILGGKNLGRKLDTADGTLHGLKLMWDTDEKELIVNWKDHPETAYYTADQVGWRIPFPSTVTELPKAVPTQPKAKFTAQVSTPQSHVHAGEGAGKK